MGYSGQKPLPALVCLLCLLSQCFGTKLPQKVKVDDVELRTIDQVLANAEMQDEEGSNPFYFTDHTHLIRREYDIVYKIEDFVDMKDMNRQKRTAALRNKVRRWTDNVVNFELEDGTFDERDTFEINKAMLEISHYTCLKFNETKEALDRVQIQKGFGGCYSHVGMIGGHQPLGLGQGCRSKQIIIHELLHAIGVHHEQTRPDRDNHVTIRFVHIKDKMEYNFKKYKWSYINNFSIPYDYSSVMHYGKTAFSETGEDTIVTKDPKYQDHIGTNPGLSMGDIRTLNSMYSCVQDSCNTTAEDCPKKGFVGKDCKCWCPGPTRSHPLEYCYQEDYEEKGSLDFSHQCKDYDRNCPIYARLGYCQKRPHLMLYRCEFSCQLC